jgi:protein-S-isoprenylcysteine O-methyltransferase Ste14
MEADYPFHTAVLLLMMTIVGIRMYWSGYADSVSGVRQTTEGEGAFRVLRLLFGLPVGIGFAAYFLWPPWMDWSRLPLEPTTRWMGLTFAATSIALLVWVQKHLSRNFTGTVQIRPGGHIVTTGPYAYVRHPMYIAFLLLGIALFLLTANWFLGGGFLLVIALVIVVRLPVEEKALENAYGEDYARYKKKTGALIPRP